MSKTEKPTTDNNSEFNRTIELADKFATLIKSSVSNAGGDHKLLLDVVAIVSAECIVSGVVPEKITRMIFDEHVEHISKIIDYHFKTEKENKWQVQ